MQYLNFLLSRMCLIDPADGRKFAINLRDNQRDICGSIISRSLNLIYTQRQEGTSTVLAIMAIYMAAISNPGKCIMFVSNNITNNRVLPLLQINADIFDGILLPTIDSLDKNRIKFGNGSYIKFVSSAEDIRGHSLDIIFVDNYNEQRDRDFFNMFGPILWARQSTLVMSTEVAVRTYYPFNEIFGDHFWGTRRVLIERITPR